MLVFPVVLSKNNGLPSFHYNETEIRVPRSDAISTAPFSKSRAFESFKRERKSDHLVKHSGLALRAAIAAPISHKVAIVSSKVSSTLSLQLLIDMLAY